MLAIMSIQKSHSRLMLCVLSVCARLIQCNDGVFPNRFSATILRFRHTL
jgi:hypothetical protein